MGNAIDNSARSNASEICDAFGEAYSLQGSETIESKLRFVKFSYELAVTLAIVNVVLPACALLGNSLVIATICAHRELRIPANLFLLSLATTDFLVCSIGQLSFAYSLIMGLLPERQNCATDSRVIMEIFNGICITASLGFLCLVTFDRFVAIQHALRYHVLVTKKRAIRAIVVIWLLSVSVSLGARLTDVAGQALWWSYVISACAIMVTIHIKIWLVSRKHVQKIYVESSRFKDIHVSLRDKRAMNTVVLVSLSLLICYLPYVMFAAEGRINAENQSQNRRLVRDVMMRVTLTLLFLNSSLNPVLYFLRSAKLRRYARKLLHSRKKKQPEDFQQDVISVALKV